MNKLLLVLAVVGAVAFGAYRLMSPGGPDLTFTGDEVLLATGDLDVRFAKGTSLDDTFMVFGGTHIEHRNAIANVSVAGLSVRHAKPIYRRYPDFHRCASPGAALAKDKVADLDVVPKDAATLKALKSSLEDFNDSIRSGGDRVCVHLRGSSLDLTSAEVREVGENITDTLRSMTFYLVDSVDRVECAKVLAGA